MLFFIVSVTIIISLSSANFLPKSNNDDLINFIDLLNNRDDDNDSIGKSKYLQSLTDEDFKKSYEQDKITEIMRLLQKNYDAREDRNYDNGDRLHFIRNPELIDEYRSHVRKRSSRELQYDGEFDEDTLKQLLLSLRRNAAFRLNNDKPLKISPVLRLGSNIGEFDPIKPAEIRDEITKKYNWGKSLERQKRVRPKLRKAEERFRPKGSYGRTSIPMAGKRGVFEDVYN